MNLQFHDIVIRNAEAADCAQLAAWWNDGSIMAHAGFPNGLGTTEEKIRSQIAADSDDTKRRLMIECKKAAIGEMSFSHPEPDTAEIGIKICDPDFREKGLGRVILSMLIEELFSMGCKKIILDTNLKNTRAQHVYELLGFRKLRVNENAWVNQLGQEQSSVDYELLPWDFVNWAKKADEEGSENERSRHK